MNLFELQERLKDFSQDQLVREMQSPTGMAPQYLVLSELQRRQRMMAEQQAQMPEDQTTVAQDAVAAAGMPQGGLSDMAQAMAPRTDMDMNDAVQPVERMADGGVVRMQPGGLAGISRDLDAYSPTMTGGDARRRMMEERDARRRRAAIAAAAEPRLRFNRDGTPNIEGFAADLAARGVLSDEELLTQEGLDPRFYPTEGRLTDVAIEEPDAEMPVRQGAPLSARPDILMDLVPEPEVTPIEILTGGGGGRRGGAPSAGYTEEDLAGVSPGRGGTEPVVGAPTILDLLSAEGGGDPRSQRALAARQARETAASFEEEALGADREAAALNLQEMLPIASTFEEEATAADAEIAALPQGRAPTLPLPDQDEDEDVRSVVGGATAPAMDDAFEQDKWLALAQFGLNLMASKQPTIGGAIGEAGLAGITALREARSERDARVAAQQARADRLAAAAARGERDTYPYRQVDDIIGMADSYAQAAESIVEDNFGTPPVEGDPNYDQYINSLAMANVLRRRALALSGLE